MNKSKHTPGPWNTGSRITRVEMTHKGWNMPLCIADCDAQHGPETEKERCANARLIAACPVMLSYIQKMAKQEDQDAIKILKSI